MVLQIYIYISEIISNISKIVCRSPAENSLQPMILLSIICNFYLKLKKIFPIIKLLCWCKQIQQENMRSHRSLPLTVSCSIVIVFLLLNAIQVRELLSQKLSSWQQSCSQPTKLPERALNLLRHTAPPGPGAAGIAEVLRHTKLGSAQPEQVRFCCVHHGSDGCCVLHF